MVSMTILAARILFRWASRPRDRVVPSFNIRTGTVASDISQTRARAYESSYISLCSSRAQSNPNHASTAPEPQIRRSELEQMLSKSQGQFTRRITQKKQAMKIFNGSAEAYSTRKAEVDRRSHAAILRLSRIRPSDRVLEVASGSGFDVEASEVS